MWKACVCKWKNGHWTHRPLCAPVGYFWRRSGKQTTHRRPWPHIYTHTHTFIYFFYILPQLLFDFTLPDYQLLKVAVWVNKQMSWSQIKWSNCWGVDRELEWSSKFGVRHYLLCVTTARVRMRSWGPASLIVNSSWCVKGLALAVV